MTQTIDGRCYGYEPAQSELNALRTKIERLKADVVQRDREIERLKYDHKLAQDAWRTEVACAERSKARPAKVAALQTEIERLKAEKDQMYQLGRSIEIERDDLKAEIERLKAELERVVEAGNALAKYARLAKSNPLIRAWDTAIAAAKGEQK